MKAKTLVLAVSLFALLLTIPASTAQAQTWQYTALGDSLAAGLNDSQGGYAARFRNYVQADTGASVTLNKRGVSGWTSANLLHALRTDESLRAEIANSQVVTWNIGANDFQDALTRFQTGSCGGADNQDCIRAAVATLKTNWNAIVAQILSLRSPTNTILRTMDNYNPAVDLARAFGVLHIVKPYLEEINRFIFLSAVNNRIGCARVYQAFNGANGEADAGRRGYISADGIHPNELGHDIIAAELRALSYAPLVAPQTVFNFAVPVFQVVENGARATIVVNRRGNTSGAASVEYSTVDNPNAAPCAAPDDGEGIGAAYARCDYATTIDTLHFAAGETQKSFTIPVVDDAHVEGTEEFSIRLNQPSGGALGVLSTAAVRVFDNDFRVEPPAVVPNPIQSSDFFVRMQYLDFLSREPEPAGFAAWMNVLNNCSDVYLNPVCDRITVSASFFRSQEFNFKGYFVYLFYKTTLGRLPRYTEIIPDMRRVSGETAEEVFARRQAFANAWVEREEFRNRYPETLSHDEFVDKLLEASGVSLSGSAVTRNSLVSDLNTRKKTRAEVLLALVEHPAVDVREHNGAFVAMQYFGYLRRDPDMDGYNGWLNYLNANPTDFRTMVRGFLNSTEYQLRFGQAQ
ncbi:MAG TPA: GDSL-type esterase/lipase family protein [Pyrinomonadaceae bacterium]|jgi:lysophospholipase L1-like esterase|nr:GDSL-type esterase/lipase family protein [Pyrinomonadaceae bacterium]